MSRRPGGELGRPYRVRGDVEKPRSASSYKATPKVRAARRESDGGVVPTIGETTELVVGKAPDFGDASAARDG